MEEKAEYHCECGRRFIIPGRKEGGPRKCPRCARIMYPQGQEPKASPKPEKQKKIINPLDQLEDTLEYEYKFDKANQRIVQTIEPFSFLSMCKKIFSLFTFRGPSYKG